jgi:hypothetical protein
MNPIQRLFNVMSEGSEAKMIGAAFLLAAFVGVFVVCIVAVCVAAYQISMLAMITVIAGILYAAYWAVTR